MKIDISWYIWILCYTCQSFCIAEENHVMSIAKNINDNNLYNVMSCLYSWNEFTVNVRNIRRSSLAQYILTNMAVSLRFYHDQIQSADEASKNTWKLAIMSFKLSKRILLNKDKILLESSGNYLTSIFIKSNWIIRSENKLLFLEN